MTEEPPSPTPTLAAEPTTAQPTSEIVAAPEPSIPPGSDATVDESTETVLGNRVRAYFEAREAANAAPAPDPEDPALAEVAANPELDRLVASTRARLEAGHAIRPGVEDLAEVRVGFVDAEAASASVVACSIDDGVVFDVETGDVVNDDVVTHNYRIALALYGELWKVTEIVRLQQWEGVGGCALAAGDYPF